MRIFNLDDLRGEVNFYYRGQDGSPVHAKFMDWVMKAWVKHFIRAQTGFLHPVECRGLPSFFKSEDGDLEQLTVELPNGPLKLEPQSEWDIKDAKAGTLLYFATSTKTLFSYSQELLDVRDYIFHILGENPELDLSKRSFQDTQRASRQWHVEQARVLQQRLAEEAAERARQALRVAQERALVLEDSSVWSKMIQGSDFWTALDHPFELHGQQYMLYRLGSQKALTFESLNMDHCVHGYGERRLRDGCTVILSLRSAKEPSVPLVTAEIYAGPAVPIPYFIQIKGYQNHDPEQTVKGVVKKMGELLPELPIRALQPLQKDPGDVNFKLTN